MALFNELVHPEAPRLPFRVVPHPLESGYGFLQRVGYDLGWGTLAAYSGMLGIEKEKLSSRSSIRALAYFFRIEDELILNKCLYSKIDESHRYSHRYFLDYQIDSNLLCDPLSRVCPQCLSETLVYWAVWDFKIVAVCPFHKCHLLFICPKCKEYLPPRRKAIHLCRCGYDFREASIRHASPNAIKVTKFLYHAAGYRFTDQETMKRVYPERVLNEGLNLVAQLMTRHLGRHEKKATGAANIQRDLEKILSALDAAHNEFLAWPRHMHSFCIPPLCGVAYKAYQRRSHPEMAERCSQCPDLSLRTISDQWHP